jgi:hypothetical protein
MWLGVVALVCYPSYLVDGDSCEPLSSRQAQAKVCESPSNLMAEHSVSHLPSQLHVEALTRGMWSRHAQV